jgi:glyoxalase superfamily protein
VGEPLTAVTPWLDAFLDVPTELAPRLREFWSRVTGWPESSARGDRGRFRSLLPPQGRAYLRVQELDEPPRVHVDLMSHDLAGDAARLEVLGADRVLTLDDVEILRSPAGQVFCLVLDDESRPEVPRAAWPTRWPGGHRSRLTHVCLDVPPGRYDAEVTFWVEATGWVPSPASRPEYTFLTPPQGSAPLRLLLQRLEDPADRPGAHLDLGTDDIPAEVARLIALGAQDEGAFATWHVLRDPVAGLPFCVTNQPPGA